MTRLKFRKWFETTDIFGFEKNYQDKDEDNRCEKPVLQFNLELMMDLLAQKRIGLFEGYSQFLSEMRWGNMIGAVKLEVDPGFTFYIKRLAVDKLGENRWITKKMFQLNRLGYGGLEDLVAQEVHEHLSEEFEKPVDYVLDGKYTELQSLVLNCYEKIKRTCKHIFIPEGIKKISDDAYILMFGVRGHGLEAPDQRRVEQNQTMITYDSSAGTIRIFNYNIESPVGKHKWEIMGNDLDLYFFPSQDRDEISECLAVHFKYY